jgi:long-chain acyl-CoA synthetase
MMNLASLLVKSAQSFSALPAVTAEGRTREYGEFVRRFGAIGAAFAAMGLRRGDRVVLWMDNCVEVLECLFACWTAGLCAVPVNAKLHEREVLHIATDCSAGLLIATPRLARSSDSISSSGIRVISTEVDEYERMAANQPMEPAQLDAADLAWIFYTSGTTGRPKGAMLSHRNLLFMTMGYYADVDAVTSRDTKLHAAPMSHASGLYSLPFLLKGAHNVVLPSFDIDEIAEVLQRHDNVSMFAAPTMLTRMIGSGFATSAKVRNFRTIYYGGGPMYVADLERALETFGPSLYQIYGQGESPMTIAGLSKAAHVVSKGENVTERLGSCGVARTGCLVRVVDDDGRDLPLGDTGEVVTHSDCTMSGYWGDEAATASALKDGWLYTGDVGSLDGNGYLTLRDRSKDMIISGGSNIYPREIEEVLLKHPAVAEVSVIGRPNAEWGEDVVAFVVTKPDQAVSDAEFDQLCLDNIARFKRPKLYRRIEALPKNNYGKVLKTELREKLKSEIQ